MKYFYCYRNKMDFDHDALRFRRRPTRKSMLQTCLDPDLKPFSDPPTHSEAKIHQRSCFCSFSKLLDLPLLVWVGCQPIIGAYPPPIAIHFTTLGWDVLRFDQKLFIFARKFTEKCGISSCSRHVFSYPYIAEAWMTLGRKAPAARKV